MNRHIHIGRGITNLFRSFLFMVFMTAGKCFAMDGLLPARQYLTEFSLVDSAFITLGHPAVITLMKWGIR